MLIAVVAAILLVMAALAALIWGSYALLAPLVGVETAGLVVVMGGLALGAGLTAAYVVHDRNPPHRSWTITRAHFPSVKAAMERYREKGERVRKVLPAFVIGGRRYFLVKYVRGGKEWLPKAETGMVVLDDQGRVQADEGLFTTLLGYVWHVEEAFAHVMVHTREQVIAGAARAEQELVAARVFLARHVLVNIDARAREALEALLHSLSVHYQKLREMYAQQGDWSRVNGRRVEFRSEEMEILRAAKRQESHWLTENAKRIAEHRVGLQRYRSELENASRLDAGQRDRLRRLLNGLELAAQGAMDTDNYKMEHAPERIDAFRTRTARALKLEERPR